MLRVSSILETRAPMSTILNACVLCLHGLVLSMPTILEVITAVSTL